MANARREWLKAIADWKLEAADEDNSRYFLECRVLAPYSLVNLVM